MKLLMIMSITIFGTVGGWIGSIFDHGNWFGLWGIVLGAVGSLFGVWVGYKAGQYFE